MFNVNYYLDDYFIHDSYFMAATFFCFASQEVFPFLLIHTAPLHWEKVLNQICILTVYVTT